MDIGWSLMIYLYNWLVFIIDFLSVGLLCILDMMSMDMTGFYQAGSSTGIPAGLCHDLLGYRRGLYHDLLGDWPVSILISLDNG